MWGVEAETEAEAEAGAEAEAEAEADSDSGAAAHVCTSAPHARRPLRHYFKINAPYAGTSNIVPVAPLS